MKIAKLQTTLEQLTGRVFPILKILRAQISLNIGRIYGAQLGLLHFTSKVGSALGAHGEFTRSVRNARSGLSLEKIMEIEWMNYVSAKPNTNSQINADYLPLFFSRYIELDRVFFEAGACDGIVNSNTLLLEEFEWSGILVEPNMVWHKALRQNRPNAMIDIRCLYPISGEKIEFVLAEEMQLSSIKKYSDQGVHGNRRHGSAFEVETISFNDLVDLYFEEEGSTSPEIIGFLSLDIEGGELKILESINWTKHKIQIISVEHNYGIDRNEISTFLKSKGFVQVLKKFSGHDSWYLDRDLHEQVSKHLRNKSKLSATLIAVE